MNYCILPCFGAWLGGAGWDVKIAPGQIVGCWRQTGGVVASKKLEMATVELGMTGQELPCWSDPRL